MDLQTWMVCVGRMALRKGKGGTGLMLFGDAVAEWCRTANEACVFDRYSHRVVTQDDAS